MKQSKQQQKNSQVIFNFQGNALFSLTKVQKLSQCILVLIYSKLWNK